ncbi:MAG TPA: ACT domain-containing protein [Spirochaetota bacterium]|nr:ACT domain-containing protein [Spirochaetota bacterium]HQO03355.1 ACT domain-containing protein [Spirochaetota bacterium]
MDKIIIELIVRNHPGVMSQVTGLFSRRAFNLEGILCAALTGTKESRMFLLVAKDTRLPQILKQLEKLYDVLSVATHLGADYSFYHELSALWQRVEAAGPGIQNAESA